jgi:hypothetical protein
LVNEKTLLYLTYLQVRQLLLEFLHADPFKFPIHLHLGSGRNQIGLAFLTETIPMEGVVNRD